MEARGWKRRCRIAGREELVAVRAGREPRSSGLSLSGYSEGAVAEAWS